MMALVSNSGRNPSPLQCSSGQWVIGLSSCILRTTPQTRGDLPRHLSARHSNVGGLQTSSAAPSSRVATMSSLAWIALEHGRDLPHLVQEHVTEVAVPVHNADLQARQATAALALEFAVLTFRDECTNFTNEVSETA